MKKLTTLVLALLLTLSLVACGGSSNNDTPKVGDFTPVPCEVAVHDFFITSYNNNYGLRRGSQPRLFPSQSRSC